ncbi:MAG: hypothetical protein H6832_04175 [Planctomycetes bacterium]|nr:hypothetical protein [Planctomycetota bacterium]
MQRSLLVAATLFVSKILAAQVAHLTIPESLSVYVERGTTKFFGGTIAKDSNMWLRRVSWEGFQNGGGLTERVGLDNAVQTMHTIAGVTALANNQMSAALVHRFIIDKTATADVRMFSSISKDLVSAQPGVHDAVFVLPFLPNTQVSLAFGVNNLTNFVTTTLASVDVGDDNTIDWLAPTTPGSHTKTIVATADERGILIRLRLASDARFPKGPYAYWRGIETSIGFVWTPGQRRCELVQRGTACGPSMTGTLSTNWQTLDVAVQGAASGRIGLLLIGGGNPIAIQFPNSPCYLYSPLHVLLPHAYDASGNASFRFSVPANLLGIGHIQDLALDIQPTTLRVESTNALTLSCGMR